MAILKSILIDPSDFLQRAEKHLQTHKVTLLNAGNLEEVTLSRLIGGAAVRQTLDSKL